MYGLRVRHAHVARARALPAAVPRAAVSVPAVKPAAAVLSSLSPLQPGPAPARPPASAPPAAEPPGDAEEPQRPHPITAAHRRIFEENARIAALNGAMDQEDFRALRQMNAEYRRAYPEDEQVLQEGYDLIADCLENRTPELVAAAQRFWQEKRASSLRRYVRRHCLSGILP